MSSKKAMVKPKKEKEINGNIFTREDLIKTAKRYKEITKAKKKQNKIKEAKKLDLQVFKLVILLSVSKLGYYNNRKVTSKFRRDPQLELIIAMTFYTNKKICGWKELQNILPKTTISKFLIYLEALGLICKRRIKRKY